MGFLPVVKTKRHFVTYFVVAYTSRGNIKKFNLTDHKTIGAWFTASLSLGLFFWKYAKTIDIEPYIRIYIYIIFHVTL